MAIRLKLILSTRKMIPEESARDTPTNIGYLLAILEEGKSYVNKWRETYEESRPYVTWVNTALSIHLLLAPTTLDCDIIYGRHHQGL